MTKTRPREISNWETLQGIFHLRKVQGFEFCKRLAVANMLGWGSPTEVGFISGGWYWPRLAVATVGLNQIKISVFNIVQHRKSRIHQQASAGLLRHPRSARHGIEGSMVTLHHPRELFLGIPWPWRVSAMLQRMEMFTRPSRSEEGYPLVMTNIAVV